MKILKRYGNDAMAPLRFCFKVLGAWPEGQTRWQRYRSYLNYPLYSLISIPFVIWFIISDAPDEGPISIFRGLSDTIGLSTFVVRGTLIIRKANNVYKLSELVTKGCKPYEKNHKVVYIKPPRLAWTPNVAFLIQITLSAMAKVEKRKASVPMSKTALQTDIIFYPLMFIFLVGHVPVWLNVSFILKLNNDEISLTCYLRQKSGIQESFLDQCLNWFFIFKVFNRTTADALIISLSTTIREKAETMKNMLSDLDKVQDNAERASELSKIVIYHNIIATIRNEIEKIISYAMLLQLLFLVISLGSPGIRLLYVSDTMHLEDLGFTACYVLWVVSQLIVYCEMCESATHSCTTLGFAAYSAYRPDMSPEAVRKLALIILRAQRPMDLTARRLIKINRRTLLKICRRSYSLYSAILKVK